MYYDTEQNITKQLFGIGINVLLTLWRLVIVVITSKQSFIYDQQNDSSRFV